jgi:hypothetical protein
MPETEPVYNLHQKAAPGGYKSGLETYQYFRTFDMMTNCSLPLQPIGWVILDIMSNAQLTMGALDF